MTSDLLLREPEGTITVPVATLNRIVTSAAELVDGVHVRRPRRNVEITVSAAAVAVTLHLAARYGTVLSMAAEDVQREVAAALEQMCGVRVERVDVVVEELV